MQTESCFREGYRGKIAGQSLSNVKSGQWLEELEEMLETTVDGLRKDSCRCFKSQNGRLPDEMGTITEISASRFNKDWRIWLDARNGQWLEEVGELMETTVNGLRKDSCTCYVE